MKQIYFFSLFLLMVVFNNSSFSQCVVPPPNVTIECGDTTTLAALPSSVTYSIDATDCAPIPIPSTAITVFANGTDDDVTSLIPIGFPFKFFGTSYNNTKINSNGVIGFGAAFDYQAGGIGTLPSANIPDNFIAGIGTDFDTTFGGTIHYHNEGVAPNRKFVVSYSNVVPYNVNNSGTSAGIGKASFQIVLNENNTFQIIIKQFSGNWSDAAGGFLATSGAENSDGTMAIVVPGRDYGDFRGIVATDLDCRTFTPVTCAFQNWKEGTTTVATTTNLTVSPITTKTYTANYLCNGTPCIASTTVNVKNSKVAKTPSITPNTNCLNPNGSVDIPVYGFNNTSTETLNYNLNGTAASQNVTLGSILEPVAQNTDFNVGSLTTSDPTWQRTDEAASCQLSGFPSYYDVLEFTPSITGSYTLSSVCVANTGINDGFAVLFQNSFNAANPCAVINSWVIANDDGYIPTCISNPKITRTLTTGVTYFLVTTTSADLRTGDYKWRFTGPTGAVLNIATPVLSLSGLSGGTITNLSIDGGSCGNISILGTYIVPDQSKKTWTGNLDTDWHKPGNWSGNSLPSLDDCVIIPNTANNNTITSLSLSALAANLTVRSGALLSVQQSSNLIVTDKVTVDNGGLMFLQSDASLIQTNNVTNQGTILYGRRANNIRGFDYVYWSSPVAGQNINNLYTTPTPGVRYYWDTIAPNANGGLGNWIDANNAIMNVGQGYIMKGSSNVADPATSIIANFSGTPNNGNLTIKAKRGNMTNATVPSFYSNPAFGISNDNWSLLGNPYPSAINGLKFLSENSTTLESTLHLWRHINNVAAIASPFYQNAILNYNASDYLAINFTGSTTPNASEIIKTGQAFMVLRKEGNQDLTGVDIKFNNAMRSDSNTPYANNNFFRSSNSNNNANLFNLEKHRIWLDLLDDATMSSETTLLGYVESATNDFDSFLDAPLYSLSSNKIYTVNRNENFIIQARKLPFNNFDTVPLAYNVLNNGNYKIAINTVDGIFTNENIYLEDLLLNTTHDLKLAPYSFSSSAGNFNDRFILKYCNTSLSNYEFASNNEIKILTSEKISIQSSSLKIKKVEIFDLLGRKIDSYENFNSKFKTLNNLNKSNNTYIIKTTLENDVVVNKKIIF